MIEFLHLPHAQAQLISIHVGHEDIRHHGIHNLCFEKLERLFAVMSFHNSMADRFQLCTKESAVHIQIVHNEDDPVPMVS